MFSRKLLKANIELSLPLTPRIILSIRVRVKTRLTGREVLSRTICPSLNNISRNPERRVLGRKLRVTGEIINN